MIDEFKEGACGVIESFENGQWLGTAEDAGYQNHDITGTA